MPARRCCCSSTSPDLTGASGRLPAAEHERRAAGEGHRDESVRTRVTDVARPRLVDIGMLPVRAGDVVWPSSPLTRSRSDGESRDRKLRVEVETGG